MKLIAERDMIRRVAAAWRNAYGRDAGSVGERLDRINGETATAADVLAIIGNASWTNLRCDECEAIVTVVIEAGQPPDYESATARLCLACVDKAHDLASRAKGAPDVT